jgi:hypothetical protein
MVVFTSPVYPISNVIESDLELNNKVVELLYDKTQDSWNYIRIRDDKKRGNSLKASRNIINNIINNISLDLICEGLPNRYFEYKRPQQYVQMTKYVNSVKQLQIQKIYDLI